MEYLGFKSFSFWTNIGSVARLFIIGYILLLVIYGFVKILPLVWKSLENSSKYQQYMSKARDLLFWNGVIYALMLGSNVILTAAFITLS